MIQIWLGTGEATWEGDPVSALPGEELLLELVITHEILGYTDFHHSADLRQSSCSHHSEKRWKLGTVWWMFSCIRPVNVNTETNLTSAFCDSSSSLPIPPLPQDLCCLWPKGALVFVWGFFPQQSCSIQKLVRGTALRCTGSKDPVSWGLYFHSHDQQSCTWILFRLALFFGFVICKVLPVYLCSVEKARR